MNTIQKFDTIHQYNELLGQETLHPLVNSERNKMRKPSVRL